MEGGLDGANIHHLENAPVVDPGKNPLGWPIHGILNPNVPIVPAPTPAMPLDYINRDDVWKERKPNGSHIPATLGRILGRIVEALNKDISVKNNAFTGTVGTNLSITTDTINEKTAAAGVTIDSVLLTDGAIVAPGYIQANVDVKTDTINERTSGTGVTIDSVLLKDGLADGVDVSTLKSDYDTHIGDSEAHQDEVTLGGGCDAALSISGQELTLADVVTQAELDARLVFSVDYGDESGNSYLLNAYQAVAAGVGIFDPSGLYIKTTDGIEKGDHVIANGSFENLDSTGEQEFWTHKA